FYSDPPHLKKNDHQTQVDFEQYYQKTNPEIVEERKAFLDWLQSMEGANNAATDQVHFNAGVKLPNFILEECDEAIRKKLEGSITLTELKIILMEIKFKIGISAQEAVTYLEEDSEKTDLSKMKVIDDEGTLTFDQMEKLYNRGVRHFTVKVDPPSTTNTKNLTLEDYGAPVSTKVIKNKILENDKFPNCRLNIPNYNILDSKSFIGKINNGERNFGGVSVKGDVAFPFGKRIENLNINSATFTDPVDFRGVALPNGTLNSTTFQAGIIINNNTDFRTCSTAVNWSADMKISYWLDDTKELKTTVSELYENLKTGYNKAYKNDKSLFKSKNYFEETLENKNKPVSQKLFLALQHMQEKRDYKMSGRNRTYGALQAAVGALYDVEVVRKHEEINPIAIDEDDEQPATARTHIEPEHESEAPLTARTSRRFENDVKEDIKEHSLAKFIKADGLAISEVKKYPRDFLEAIAEYKKTISENPEIHRELQDHVSTTIDKAKTTLLNSSVVNQETYANYLLLKHANPEDKTRLAFLQCAVIETPDDKVEKKNPQSFFSNKPVDENAEFKNTLKVEWVNTPLSKLIDQETAKTVQDKMPETEQSNCQLEKQYYIAHLIEAGEFENANRAFMALRCENWGSKEYPVINAAI
ncbi:MAG: hypothetical protein NTU49_07590, partial [Gammaproteobacteria bacterium]|nr:hypothetical protein [Gammaproteobacteria bacterium]